MTAGLFARMPRVLVLVLVALLATTALALAAGGGTGQTPPATETVVTPARPTLVVPDVRGQVYVFAKGALEQAGFAWKVDGAVKGYAANVVAAQTPAPGSKVYVDGSPLITLQLKQNGRYKQEGMPEDASPYAGTPAKLVGPVAKAKAAGKRTAQASAAASAPKPASAPKAKAPAATKAKAKVDRKPAFQVAGAPSEPLDEIPLTERAVNLKRWVAAHPKRTRRNVDHWLYQHNWIVTGAQFGWSHGAAALQTLIEADRTAQQLWGVGRRSEQVARRALAEVGARSE